VRVAVLEVCVGIAALLFLASMGAVARHRAQRRPEGAQHSAALPEYVWAVVPWVLLAGAAFPSVSMTVWGR